MNALDIEPLEATATGGASRRILEIN